MRFAEKAWCVLGLELGWRDVAEGLVQAVVVKPAEVGDDRELQLRAGAPDAVCDELGLEGVDEALGEAVVVGVADRADRLQHLVIVEDLREVKARVFAIRGLSDERA